MGAQVLRSPVKGRERDKIEKAFLKEEAFFNLWLCPPRRGGMSCLLWGRMHRSSIWPCEGRDSSLKGLFICEGKREEAVPLSEGTTRREGDDPSLLKEAKQKASSSLEKAFSSLEDS